jgi:aspartyl-tRNA(Asn)/glutamyl-tRNA(Gln) amidotransferase subunit C
MDTKTVRNIAVLARIRIEDRDLAPMARELSGILGWIEQLNEVKTDGVEPMTSVAALTLPRRDDKVTDGDSRDAVLKNAPEPEDGFYTVPKVVE